MSIAAGSLNRRLRIEQRDAGADDAGQPLETWSTVRTVWADIRAPKGLAAAEMVAAGHEASLTTYSARIRYCTDLTAQMRAVEVVGEDDGQTFDIEQVIPDLGGRQHTDLVLTTGAV